MRSEHKRLEIPDFDFDFDGFDFDMAPKIKNKNLIAHNEAKEIANALHSLLALMREKSFAEILDMAEFRARLARFRKSIKNLDHHHLGKAMQAFDIENPDADAYENFKKQAIKHEELTWQYTKKSQGFFSKTTRKSIKELKQACSRLIERTQANIGTRRTLSELEKKSLSEECQKQLDTINTVMGQIQDNPERLQADMNSLEEQRMNLCNTMDEINNPIQKVRTYSRPGSRVIRLNGNKNEKLELVKNSLGLPVETDLEDLPAMKVGEVQFAKADILAPETFRLDPPEIYKPEEDINNIGDEDKLAYYLQKKMKFSFSSGVGSLDNNYMAIMKWDVSEHVPDEYLYDKAYKLLLKFHAELPEKDLGKNLVLSNAVHWRAAQAIYAVCKLSPEKFKKPRYYQDLSSRMDDWYLARMEEHQRKKTTRENIKEDRYAEVSIKEAKEREEPGFWQRLMMGG